MGLNGQVRAISQFIAKLGAVFLLFIIFSGEAHAKIPQSLSYSRGNESICDRISRKQILPKTNKDGVFEIGIGIQPISIKNVNPKDNSAEIDFYLTIEYDIDEDLPNVKCVGSKAAKVWDIFYNPDIELMSISDPEYLQGYHWLVENKKFAYMTRAKGRVELNGNFRSFPFDNLMVRITVSPEDNSKSVTLKPSLWYHNNIANLLSDFEDIKIPGWHLDNAYFERYNPIKQETDKGYWDEMSLVLCIKRNPTTIFTRTTIPLLVLFSIAFFSFLINDGKGLPSGNDRFADARISLQAGTLLALFAFSLYIMDVIPETSYLTLGDINWLVFMLSTLIIIFSEFFPNSIKIKNSHIPLKMILLIISASLVIVLMICQFVIFLI